MNARAAFLWGDELNGLTKRRSNAGILFAGCENTLLARSRIAVAWAEPPSAAIKRVDDACVSGFAPGKREPSGLPHFDWRCECSWLLINFEERATFPLTKSGQFNAIHNKGGNSGEWLRDKLENLDMQDFYF